MKKLFLFFLCLGLFLTVFTGCNNTSSITNDSTLESEEPSRETERTSTAFTGETSDVLIWLYAADSMESYVDTSFYERIKTAGG